MNALTLLTTATVLSQDPSALPSPAAPPVIHRAVTDLDFEAREVRASPRGPRVKGVTVRTVSAGFAPLIRLRLDFDAEMSASTSQIH